MPDPRDEAQQRKRAERDPERERIRRLRDEERKGKPGSAASIARIRQIEAWRLRRRREKQRRAEGDADEE